MLRAFTPLPSYSSVIGPRAAVPPAAAAAPIEAASEKPRAAPPMAQERRWPPRPVGRRHAGRGPCREMSDTPRRPAMRLRAMRAAPARRSRASRPAAAEARGNTTRWPAAAAWRAAAVLVPSRIPAADAGAAPRQRCRDARRRRRHASPRAATAPRPQSERTRRARALDAPMPGRAAAARASDRSTTRVAARFRQDQLQSRLASAITGLDDDGVATQQRFPRRAVHAHLRCFTTPATPPRSAIARMRRRSSPRAGRRSRRLPVAIARSIQRPTCRSVRTPTLYVAWRHISRPPPRPISRPVAAIADAGHRR